MPDVPSRVLELVETFDRNIDAYKNQQYNEAQLRSEFIDPFFEVLGWDVTNKSGYAPAYKDVIHEDAIKIGGYTKAPDYCFRIGGARKFFLEAKKPSIDIKADPHPAYQLRRYAWSAKLPLSILTDFEEFAVYDCRIRPKQTDKSDTARIMYYTYKQYTDHWPDIENIFGKNAVLKGSFDKFAADTKAKRGTATVDKEFLADIENWREMLARTIALKNTSLTRDQINFAVQRTIDRIVFLRMCEDRGIEHYSQLLGLSTGRDTYARLCQLFTQADAKYNSGLFHFRHEKGRPDPDELTPNITIDDTPLKWILHNLYYPQSPYEFSVLPAEILGNVYEQFLGKVIRLTPAHQAKIEEKPEVKKAGGVYYTPAYIVDYIVKNTVGRLLHDAKAIPSQTVNVIPSAAEGSIQNCHSERSEESHSSIANRKSQIENHKPLTPAQVANLRILDPACGSGSFLLGAYTYLLDYHRDWYLEQDPASSATGKYKKKIYQAKAAQWFLTIAEKKRILLNNIFGVDIDSQAVEVTKLSLLLKVLEGETSETIGQTYRMFRERALPDLADNIKCGNSLIGPDFFDNLEHSAPDDTNKELRTMNNEQQTILDDLYKKINPFDYKTEFPQVFSGKPPGFHAVIGNPPYVRQESLGDLKKYFQNHYSVYHGIADLYTYFIEKGISLLVNGGRFAYIVANKWMRANYGEPLRRWLKHQHIEHIVDFGDLLVFKTATTYPCILTLSKKPPGSHFSATRPTTLQFQSLQEFANRYSYQVVQTSLNDKGWSLTDETTAQLLDKLTKAGPPLQKYVNGKIFRGILTGLNKAFIIDSSTKEHLIQDHPKNAELIKPFLLGRNIKRYVPLKPDNYLIFIPKGWTHQKSPQAKHPWHWLKENYPAIANYLAPHQSAAEKRCDKGDYWWELRACAYYNEFEKAKLMLPDISLRGNFTLDSTAKMYCTNTCYIIGSSDKYLLAILNSSLINFFYRNLSSAYRGGYLRFIFEYLVQIPIRAPSSAKGRDITRHNAMVKLVDRMLDLHKKLAAAKVPNEKTQIQRQIKNTDKKIDQLVYELYNLTPEEIAIIEET